MSSAIGSLELLIGTIGETRPPPTGPRATTSSSSPIARPPRGVGTLPTQNPAKVLTTVNTGVFSLT